MAEWPYNDLKLWTIKVNKAKANQNENKKPNRLVVKTCTSTSNTGKCARASRYEVKEQKKNTNV